jgi:hypothetical protein
MTTELADPIPDFWFCKPPKQLSSDEILDKLCEEQKFKECYDNVIHCYVLWSNSNSIIDIDNKCSDIDRDVEDFGYGKEIWKMYDDIDYLENEYSKLVRRCHIYPPILYMREFYELADDICKKYDAIFSLELCMNDSEIVNGYALYNVKGEQIMNRCLYEECIKLWKSNKIYTQEEFMDLYDETACTDWAKQDEHGESYCGYWKYPDGSPEKLDAWNLTRTANGTALWNLPYPKEVIFKTIELGCSNRRESVRYSNFLCEWLKRKLEQMST